MKKIEFNEPKFNKKDWEWWIKMFLFFFILFLVSMPLCIWLKEFVNDVILFLTPLVLSALSAVFLGGIISELVATNKISKSVFAFCTVVVVILIYKYPREDLFHFDNDIANYIMVYLIAFLTMLFMVLFRIILSVFAFAMINLYNYFK